MDGGSSPAVEREKRLGVSSHPLDDPAPRIGFGNTRCTSFWPLPPLFCLPFLEIIAFFCPIVLRYTLLTASFHGRSNPDVFDNVNVYGDILNSDIHHNYYGHYSYGLQVCRDLVL